MRASQAQGDLLRREGLLLRTMRDLANARGCPPDGRLGDYFDAEELAALARDAGLTPDQTERLWAQLDSGRP